jgi:hypothetical protein
METSNTGEVIFKYSNYTNPIKGSWAKYFSCTDNSILLINYYYIVL